MAEVKSLRRFYLHKRLYAALYEDSELALTWRSKQEAQSGTELPASFPERSTLGELGYSTVEDLDGADIEELSRVGFSSNQATSILAALQPLL